MNELQMSFYARKYNVLGVETRDHVTANYQTHDGQARDDANNATGYSVCRPKCIGCLLFFFCFQSFIIASIMSL